MHLLDQNLIIKIAVFAFLTVVGLLNLPRMMSFVMAQHDHIERLSRPVRKFKYDCLVPWVDKLPFSADVMTGSRLVFISASLLCFVWRESHPGWNAWTMPLFYIGWSTDYLDGLKAHGEFLRRGTRTVHGEYFDPCVDMICFALMSIALYPYYPWRIIVIFSLAILARTFLFGGLIIARLVNPRWRRLVKSSVLPKSITGEVKAGFIALSFGLILQNPNGQENLDWAWRVLVMAVVFEGLTLSYLVRRTMRGDFAETELSVVKPKKTGTE